MQNATRMSRVVWGLILIVTTGVQAAEATSLKIWNDTPVPTTRWDEWGTPIGNGRLGGIYFGNVADELIQFNEDSLWTGGPGIAVSNFGDYQPFGDLLISLPHHSFTNYYRELDLARGVGTLRYTSGGVHYTREYFASYPDQVLVIRLTADQPGSYTGSVKLTDKHFASFSTATNTVTASGLLADDYYLTSRFNLAKNGTPEDIANAKYRFEGNNLRYESQMRVILDGGTLSPGEEGELLVDAANSITIILAADTEFLADPARGWRGENPHMAVTAQMNAASARSYNELLTRHLNDYQSLFGRLELDLGKSVSSKAALPTDQRLEDYRIDPNDPELEALLAQFGRYLMISSSREGSLPPNLQGLWNPMLQPPWASDYHINVNLQMNYWLTGPGNLSDCDVALTDWMLAMMPQLQSQTSNTWGGVGATSGRTLNIFGGCGNDDPTKRIDFGWASWLVWEHYAFTRDEDYLANVALPILGENVVYWDNDLQDVGGVLWATNCQSPESSSGDGVSFAQEVIWELFTEFVEACDVLGISEFTSLTGTGTVSRNTIENKLSILDVPAVGVVGQLEEFQNESSSVENNTHRHISHLVGLFPGRQFTPNATPALADACEVSLDYRTDGGTAWSKAHKASARARLYDGQHAHSLLQNIAQNHIFPSLLSSINNLDKFQIDCNFGYPAAVFEMLLQSHEEELHLLPALAPDWPTGSVRGICGRGGFVVDMTWSEGTLYQAGIHSKLGGPCTVRYGDSVVTLAIPQGSTVQLDGNLNLIDPVVEVAPSVGFSSPVADIAGEPISEKSRLTLLASAYDLNGNDTIARVSLYESGTLIGVATHAPYEWEFTDLPEGTYTFTLIATDTTGRDSAVATRTVSLAEFDPTVEFALPSTDLSGMPESNTLIIVADANDQNGDETIAQVTLYQDDVVIGTDFRAPYEWTIANLPAGNAYTFKLVATDKTGRESTPALRTVGVSAIGEVIRMEAEEATFVNGNIFSDGAASGGEAVDGKGGFNISWGIYAPAGSKDLAFRLRGNGRSMGVYVNGSKAGVITGTSDAWQTYIISVDLVEGMNTIELRDSESTAEFFADYLEFTVSGGVSSSTVYQHLDATRVESVVVNASSQVSAWQDLSGNGRDAVADVGTVLFPSAQISSGGFAGMDFGSGKNALTALNNADADHVFNTNSFSLLVAMVPNDIASDDSFILGTKHTLDCFAVKIEDQAPSADIKFMLDLSSTHSVSVEDGSSYVMGVTLDSVNTTAEYWVNTVRYSRSMAAKDYTAGNKLTLGRAATTLNDVYRGMMGEFIVWDYKLSDADYTYQRERLSRKWVESRAVFPQDAGEALATDHLILEWNNLLPITEHDAVYVDVYFGTEANRLTMTKLVDGGLGTTAADAGSITAGTTYYWAVDTRMEGALNPIQGPVYSFTAVEEAIPAPTGLVATPGRDQISLDWADSEDDGISYNVYRRVLGGYGAAIATGIVSSDYVDHTAVNGITYSYVVTALDSSANESLQSEEVSATGSGSIPRASFTSWAGYYGLPGDEASMTIDSDIGGFNNLLEFAFGGDPADGSDDVRLRPTSAIMKINGSNMLTYTFRRIKDRSANGLEYVIETTDDLTDKKWTAYSSTLTTEELEDDSDLEQVTAHIPMANYTNRFMRLRIPAPSPE